MEEKISFQKPPLVEIVAELRWDVLGLPMMPVQPPPGQSFPVHPKSGMLHEELYSNFAKAIAKRGYTSLERLVPQGFPSLAFKPVYRYRHVDATSPLYQLGPGLFCVNMIPPHKSWESFRPVIQEGVEFLLQSLVPSQDIKSFSTVNLRYIDAFKENLTDGYTTYQFISDVLGIKAVLPDIIVKHSSDKSQIKTALTFTIPVSIGNMVLNIGEGVVNNASAIVMETSVFSKAGNDQQEIMSLLDKAHEIIYTSFIGMTTKIHGRMDPISLPV